MTIDNPKSSQQIDEKENVHFYSIRLEVVEHCLISNEATTICL